MTEENIIGTYDEKESIYNVTHLTANARHEADPDASPTLFTPTQHSCPHKTVPIRKSRGDGEEIIHNR